MKSMSNVTRLLARTFLILKTQGFTIDSLSDLTNLYLKRLLIVVSFVLPSYGDIFDTYTYTHTYIYIYFHKSRTEKAATLNATNTRR